jgi:hypothetical protein
MERRKGGDFMKAKALLFALMISAIGGTAMAAQTIPDMRDAEMGGAPAASERTVVIPEGSERLDVTKTRRPRSSRSRCRM